MAKLPNPHPGLKPAARRVERTVLDWLGLLPDSDPPNDEPDYEARLRALGKALHTKNWTGPECLAALSLHLASLESPASVQLGEAQVLATGARGLLSVLARADGIGQQLADKAALTEDVEGSPESVEPTIKGEA